MQEHFINSPSIIFIGHLAIDTIIRFKRLNDPSIGGTVSFGSLALRKYSKSPEIGLVSSLGSKNFDKSMLKIFKNKNIDLSGLKWSNTNNTNFVHNYIGHTRKSTLRSRSPTLNFADFPKKYYSNHPDIIVLAPLCNEISYEYVSQILKKFPDTYIGIDLQGFIRIIDKDGIILYLHDEQVIDNICKIIEMISDRLILKGSEIEMKLLSGENNSEDVMKYFQDFNNNGIYIITLGEEGSLIAKKGERLLKIPAFKPKVLVDETGAGDVYLAIFLYELYKSNQIWDEIQQAGLCASAAASFLVEKKGPSGFQTKRKVSKRIEKKNYIIN
jgi:sugar/nucleoside kinase (ribokinase family)